MTTLTRMHQRLQDTVRELLGLWLRLQKTDHFSMLLKGVLHRGGVEGKAQIVDEGIFSAFPRALVLIRICNQKDIHAGSQGNLLAPLADRLSIPQGMQPVPPAPPPGNPGDPYIYMCVCIYICTYKYTYTYIMPIHIHTHTRMSVSLYVHIYIYMCAYVHTHFFIHSSMYSYTNLLLSLRSLYLALRPEASACSSCARSRPPQVARWSRDPR